VGPVDVVNSCSPFGGFTAGVLRFVQNSTHGQEQMKSGFAYTDPATGGTNIGVKFACSANFANWTFLRGGPVLGQTPCGVLGYIWVNRREFCFASRRYMHFLRKIVGWTLRRGGPVLGQTPHGVLDYIWANRREFCPANRQYTHALRKIFGITARFHFNIL
jgi:hypothetical protein